MRISRALLVAALAATGAALAPVGVAPGGAQTVQFFGQMSDISCVSTSVCVAVGYREPAKGANYPAAFHWTGRSWSQRTVPSPSVGSDARLTSVACTASSRCEAVGTAGGAWFAELWNGVSWSLQTTPSSTGTTVMRAISCSSSSACTAVGSKNGVTTHPLVERWNGTNWHGQALPHTADGSELEGVSCPTATTCTAVGGIEGHSGRVVLRWDGTTWTKQVTPVPTDNGAKFASLHNVLCRTATTCTAVGDYAIYTGCCSHVTRTLVERWNGTTWSVQDSYHGDNYALYDVACSASTACTAVGATVSTGPPLTYPAAFRWNGTSWTVQTTGISGGTAAFLGVACPALHKCFAVGSAGDSLGVTSTLIIARWNGTDWKRQR